MAAIEWHYRARYYDPGTGRFLNEDPAAFLAGSNFYKYVDGRPTKYVDPDGTVQLEFETKFNKISAYDALTGPYLGDTKPTFVFDYACNCIGNGKFRLELKIKAIFTVIYHFEFTKRHELEHVDVAQQFLTKKKVHWETFERTFDSLSACKQYAEHFLYGAAPNVMTDMEGWWPELNKEQASHESLIDRIFH